MSYSGPGKGSPGGSSGRSRAPRFILLLTFAFASVPNSGGLEHHHGGGAAAAGGRRSLDEYVHHYEELSYSSGHVDAQHHRHKRSLPEEDHRVEVDFHAHHRHFRLRLKRDHSVFHDGLRIEDGLGRDKMASLDLSHIYHGHLEGQEAGSRAFGSIHDGVFDGQVHTPEGTYYLERAHKYFPQRHEEAAAGKNHSFHSVIYREHHLKDPFRHSKAAGLKRPGCGVSESVQDWMESVQNSGEPTPLPPPPSPQPLKESRDEHQQRALEQLQREELESSGPTYKYSAQANDPNNKRVKRALENNSNRKSCSLYIQTDPLFWDHIYEQENGKVKNGASETEEGRSKTEKEILSLIAQHVKAVNIIYSDTTFDGKYSHKGYMFEVQRVKIHDSKQCKTHPFDSDKNQFCIPNIDVSNFLNLHSKSDHEEFCLAYVFTYRDFTGGTLGLAWVASATGASGGICETYKSYKENINNKQNTTKRSLNTGIITFVNYNSRVAPKVSQLTLAHEIGHNFGSPHDYPAYCRPGGQSGNYIMFASATSGDRDNNNKFSNCSKHNVSRVLDAIFEGQKRNCFQENDGAFCGNKIVEEGEECDCGFDESECAEQCCYPRKVTNETEANNKRNMCKRKPNAQCSPSEGPCCSQTCRFLSSSSAQSKQCKGEDDCTEAARCDGTQAKCPEPKAKPNHQTECNQGTQVCYDGECKFSICLKYGLESCFLTSETISDKRQLCELACRQKDAKNSTCMSTTELVAQGLVAPGSGLTSGLSLRPGSPCDNYQGYCDVFLKCRKVDAEGPLVRLKNLLLNEETLVNIAQWVTEFWWAVLLISIAFVIFMACFIKCFAIHTPSSNPRMPKAYHLSETLRRPVRSLKQQHHGGYRAASSGYGAPPPYPGRNGGGGGGGSSQPNGGAAGPSRGSAIPGGPGRGYGEGRGHYNRSRGADMCAAESRSAAAHHPMQVGGGSRGGGGGVHPDARDPRRSRGGSRDPPGGNRGSRIEMSPLR